jgi:hypothetical protein
MPVAWTGAAVKLDFAQTSRKNTTVSDNKKVEAVSIELRFLAYFRLLQES